MILVIRIVKDHIHYGSVWRHKRLLVMVAVALSAGRRPESNLELICSGDVRITGVGSMICACLKNV